MLAVMPNVPVKMPFMVTTDVLASMFTMTRKYITVIVVCVCGVCVCVREREKRERELYPCSFKNIHVLHVIVEGRMIEVSNLLIYYLNSLLPSSLI